MVLTRPLMLLDVSLLRRARIENIERLAKALGVPVKGEQPERKRDVMTTTRARAAYQNQLVNAVMRELRRDAMRAEFERLARV